MRRFLKKLSLALFFTFAGANVAYADKLNALIAENGKYTKAVMDTVDLKINGTLLEGLTMPPVLYKDYTLVPVKEVFEALGATVIWNPSAGETYIIGNNQVMILEKDSDSAILNAETLKLPVPVKNINDKTMAPAAFISERMGMSVGWDGVNKILSIDSTAPNSGEQPFMPDTPTLPTPPAGNSGQDERPEVPKVDPVPQLPSSSQNGPVDVSNGSIKAMAYPTASITSLTLPESGGGLKFQLQALSEISSLNYFIQPDPDRLVIDIANASLDTPSTSYQFEGNSVCRSVRMSQYQVEPEKSARIVFDLDAAVRYSVSLSADRKTITVDFMQNSVTDVQFRTDGTSDYVILNGQWAPAASIFPLSDPSRLVIDLPGSTMSVQKNEYVSGIFADAIRTGQFDEGTGRVVINRKGHSSWSVSYEGTQTIIKITEPTYKNLEFDNANNQLAIRKPDVGITAASVIETDDYSNLRYIITLPGDYSSYYGKGEYYINSDKVSSISVNNMGQTQFVINERSIFATRITEDAEYIYVGIINPKEKYSKVVLVDPGHGLADPGTSGFGLIEKDLNLDITLKLLQLFGNDPTIKMYSTRLSDVYPTLDERAELANKMADLFVSVHNNYIEQNSSANGTEVFYYPHANDAQVGFTSEQAANIIHNRLITDLGTLDRKVKSTKYVVLSKTEVPAVLCEIGFLSNYDEAMKLATESYRQAAAESIAKGIREVFGVYSPGR